MTAVNSCYVNIYDHFFQMFDYGNNYQLLRTLVLCTWNTIVC